MTRYITVEEVGRIVGGSVIDKNNLYRPRRGSDEILHTGQDAGEEILFFVVRRNHDAQIYVAHCFTPQLPISRRPLAQDRNLRLTRYFQTGTKAQNIEGRFKV